jgi:CrcB protein
VQAGRIPWTTLAINVSGAFVLGVLLTFVLERWPPTQYVRPFGAIGVLGAFTTFSTFAVESDVLIKDGHVGTAVAYDVMSLALGLVAAYLGIAFGRAWPPAERRPYPDFVEDAEDA